MSFNLANNPVGRAGTTGYTAQAATGTPVISIGQGPSGGPAGIADYWIRATTSVGTASVDITNSGAGASLVDSGTIYTFSVSVHPTSATTMTATAIIQWFDGSNGLIGSSFGTPTAVTSGVWSGRISVTAAAPPAAVRAGLVIRVSSSPSFSAGFVHIATGFMLEAATTVNPYYDGNTPNYMWVGAPDLAPSWGPVVTVVANPLNQPPRNEVTVTIPPGYVMQTAALNRWADSTATPVRTQPAAGFDTRVVYDYEMPYDTSLQYELITDCFLPGGTTVWSENWANLSNWTSDATFAASSGTAVFTSADNAGHFLRRSVTPKGSYRVTVDSLAQTNTNGVNNSVLTFGQAGGANMIDLSVDAAGRLRVYDWTELAIHNTAITAGSPITVDFLGTAITISGIGGSWTSVKRKSTDFNQISVVGSIPSGSGTFTVGPINVSTYPPTIHADVYSPTVAISPLNSWMIHPGNPGLSLPISSTDRTALMIRSIGDVVNPSAGTDHTILGQSEPITTVSGPRYSPRFQLVLGTRTRVQEQALIAMLQDGTPLLFRFPASFPVGMDEGFYSVGDVTRTRFAQRPGEQMRNFTLPLTGVQSPVVTVQNTGWSWAALAAQFTTWAQVAAAFNTWADVAANNRKAGY